MQTKYRNCSKNRIKLKVSCLKRRKTETTTRGREVNEEKEKKIREKRENKRSGTA